MLRNRLFLANYSAPAIGVTPTDSSYISASPSVLYYRLNNGSLDTVAIQVRHRNDVVRAFLMQTIVGRAVETPLDDGVGHPRWLYTRLLLRGAMSTAMVSDHIVRCPHRDPTLSLHSRTRTGSHPPAGRHSSYRDESPLPTTHPVHMFLYPHTQYAIGRLVRFTLLCPRVVLHVACCLFAEAVRNIRYITVTPFSFDFLQMMKSINNNYYNSFSFHTELDYGLQFAKAVRLCLYLCVA